jgi:hypothetical protein
VDLKALQLKKGQQQLTPEQEAEARRFALERIKAQLSTEPADEQQAEAWLRKAYEVAGLVPPKTIHWLDGPLQLMGVLLPPSVWASVRANVEASVWASVRASVRASVEASVWANVRASVWASVWASVEANVRASVWASVEASIWASVWANVRASVRANVEASVWASVKGYANAPWLAFYHYFDAYLAPNDLHALAQFNELVSGYWLGKDVAVIVRRPKILSRDAQGRLHSATGKCIEYRDGWGFYAWHGVRVPEKVITAPETLTREDFLNEPDIEVRRVIQERMGQRFVSILGSKIVDEGPRGRLHEVRVPNDPERIARYVEVQDASTSRQYFLRVPPTIQTADAAVAWTFNCTIENYQPIQET